ncbi:cell division protein ZapB [Rubritepida flocculans]|uniref:cell division protein ZapB n=1 Tax=Rubritepida flocculans TaxID=182403 RepID=UPI0012EBFE31|nr:cell division protein ZapB [Rubritepida flocculans]
MADLLLIWMLVLGPLALLAWGIERLFARHPGTHSESGESFPPSEESDTIAALQAQIDRLKAAGREVIRQREQLREELEQARAVIAAQQRELDSLRSSGAGGAPPDMAEDRGKFQRAKRAFAERFHPDRATGGTMDRLIREQVFKEFWAELEKIERGR